MSSLRAHFQSLQSLGRRCFSNVVELNHLIVRPPSYRKTTPIFVLHGLLGNLQNWRSISGPLSSVVWRDIYLIDIRNHGYSGWSNDISYPDMARDIIQLAEKYNHKTVSLVGHSMGGKAAMRTALEWPEFVSELCVVDTAPVDYTVKNGNRSMGAISEFLKAMKNVPETALESRQSVDQALKAAIPDMFVRQFIMTNLVPSEDAKGYRWRVNLDALCPQLDTIARFPVPERTDTTYNGPTLFIKGERSDLIKQEAWPEVLRLFPQARLVSVPGAGHFVHSEKPQVVSSLLADFFMPAKEQPLHQ
eukprot:TRINITY_DN12115_c0_g1::TRINITY_DN12115_c0_g1_i1::g.9683::m.9683 TRINITY_DN12115_c0_g1::TRINITY_DN12115_c0_g1_i1::g.9683  ORF type:complete len:315 (+),score=15.59,sp/Q8NFV4/ABHDB_HUMAN/38.19/3e-48,Abhydrolase_6/PF12697.2/9.8e-32,Abhydrolase_1/PF00561.15/6e-16,Abhydrolase_5/PF12695.2/7.9e-15,PGAP1/PF07819.8/7.2e-06,Esterase/PF00756.15/1.7e+03,Esterase/PF00756.15/0.00071,Thioesterase/PF00975.15/0.00064,Lipase_3/PF01764.20/0.0034,DUF915/PF06028.6/0.0044,DUF915/PF06028.6/4.5e+03,DUF900/PF05990.7/0.0